MTDINLPDDPAVPESMEPAAVVPPTRRQLMMLASDMGMASIDETVMKFALAALARWGIRQGILDSSITPPPEAVEPTEEELERAYESAYQPAWEQGDSHDAHLKGLRAVFALAAPPAPAEEEVADPPPELVHRWVVEGQHYTYETPLSTYIATQAARWGAAHALPAPAEGEVGELVAWMKKQVTVHEVAQTQWAKRFVRAATLLEQLSAAAPAVVPVAVTERLPEPGVKVLAHYVNDLGKGKTVCAIWVPAKTRSDSDGDYDFTEYDEEDDTFYWPEGWYEAIENCDDWDWVKGDEGEVVYWQPLPKWPARALPLPSGEVEG